MAITTGDTWYAEIDVPKKPTSLTTKQTGLTQSVKSEIIKAIKPNINDMNTMTISVYDIDFKSRKILEGYNAVMNVAKNMYESITSADKDFSLDDLKPLQGMIDDVKGVYDSIKDAVSGDLDKVVSDLMENIKSKVNSINNPELINKKHIYDIVVPAPNRVSDAFGHRYTTSEISPTDIMYKSITANIAATVVPGLAGAMRSAIEYDVKIAQRNNYTTNLNIINSYEGSNLREFKFSIIFMFDSQEEVKNVFRAIMLLKKHASALEDSTNNNAYLSMSSVFKFSFGSDKYNDILDIQNNESGYFFLTNIGITLGEGQEYINKFKDGTPKQIILDLDFRSRQPDYIMFNDKG